MTKLLSGGRTDLLTDFVSNRSQRKFKAFLVKQPDGKVGFEFMQRAVKPGDDAAATPGVSKTSAAKKSASRVAAESPAPAKAADKLAAKKAPAKKAAVKKVAAAKSSAAKSPAKKAAKKAAR